MPQPVRLAGIVGLDTATAPRPEADQRSSVDASKPTTDGQMTGIELRNC